MHRANTPPQGREGLKEIKSLLFHAVWYVGGVSPASARLRSQGDPPGEAGEGGGGGARVQNSGNQEQITCHEESLQLRIQRLLLLLPLLLR